MNNRPPLPLDGLPASEEFASLGHWLHERCTRHSEAVALVHCGQQYRYCDIYRALCLAAVMLRQNRLRPGDRVAVLAQKRPGSLVAMFATALAGGVFVPVNPLLKPSQQRHILSHSGARILVTDNRSLTDLELTGCRNESLESTLSLEQFDALLQDSIHTSDPLPSCVSRRDLTSTNTLAALLYTSGSTGLPKGIMISHENLILGAQSVSSYLHNTPQDRILAVLPLSFDYGLSQVSTAWNCGASVVLIDYLLPKDVINAVLTYQITGLAGVPHLWSRLSCMSWPQAAVRSLRYITNSGGAMPVAVTRRLRERLPKTDIYLMYGLTEAFRSTYLSPERVDLFPESIGKPVPNARIDILHSDGRACAPFEQGQLLHSGPLVAQGYWADKHATEAVFVTHPVSDEPAVWTGDTGYKDNEGQLYHVARTDELIKIRGYRISPMEIEEVLYQDPGVLEAVIFDLPGVHEPSIVACVSLKKDGSQEALQSHCQQQLPGYMLPTTIHQYEALPRNANGKLDRARLKQEHGVPIHQLQDRAHGEDQHTTDEKDSST